MALPSVLSQDALARFRTKRCERLLATGTCSFGKKCQYSHDGAWLRRNPRKYKYAAKLCADFAQGGCEHRMACRLAHSLEEVLYHPSMYKTAPCEACSACTDYYCPFVHAAVASDSKEASTTSMASLTTKAVDVGARDPPPSPRIQTDGAASSKTVASQPQQVAAPAGPSHTELAGDRLSRDWCQFDDRLWLAAAALAETPSELGSPGDGAFAGALCGHAPGRAASSSRAGVALIGGRVVPGLLLPKGGDAGEVVKCVVKLVRAGRREHREASKVVKEVKRWATISASPAARSQVVVAGGTAAVTGARGPPRLHEVKRTIATVCIAMPPWSSSLARSAGALTDGVGGSLADRIAAYRPLEVVAMAGVGQLIAEVQDLHSIGLAHMCIAPDTVLVDDDGILRLGDFLGKIRALYLCGHGWEDGLTDEAWCMWYPAEVHEVVHRASTRAGVTSSTTSDLSVEVDGFRVDAWQLGVVIFFLLFSEHPFGDYRDPALVCRNIREDRPVNLGRLVALPLFRSLVTDLLAQSPDRRPMPAHMPRGHSALWSSQKAAGDVSPPESLADASLGAERLEQATPSRNRRSSSCGSANSIDVRATPEPKTPAPERLRPRRRSRAMAGVAAVAADKPARPAPSDEACRQLSDNAQSVCYVTPAAEEAASTSSGTGSRLMFDDSVCYVVPQASSVDRRFFCI